MGDQAAPQALRALADAERGDLRAAEELLARGSTSTAPEAVAWRLSLSAVAWMAGVEGRQAPTVPELHRWIDAAPKQRAAAATAAWIAARGHLLALEGAGLEQAAQLHQQLIRGHDDPRVVLAGELLSLWRAVCRGATVDVEQPRNLERQAAAAGLATATMEAAALRALAEERQGQLREALTTARRAMRMARTEGQPQGEYLAALVLARMRRCNHQPHLAARILVALRQYASPPWHGWIDWELTLASGLDAAPMTEPPPSATTSAATSLLGWLQAASDGDRPEFDRLTEELRTRLATWSPAAADFEQARLVVDPLADAKRHPHIEAWRRRESHAPPGGMAGLGASTTGESHLLAWVVADPSWPQGVRVLAAGAGLARRCSAPSRTLSSAHARTYSLIAALALAGPAGLTEDDAFARAYGFAFRPEVHRNVFNVAIHRARGLLAEIGEILRDEERLSLRIRERIAFPDPQYVLRLTDRVLRCVAFEGKVQAKDIASALGISVRSTQNALEELIDEGACERHKVGRRVQYVLEDTTFREPTQHRGGLDSG